MIATRAAALVALCALVAAPVNATDIRLRAVERLGPERVESVVLDRERREVLPPGRFESEPVRIAKGSVLDVGLGVRGEASATFQVQLCAERSCERLLSHTPKRANAWTDRSIELEADRQGRLVFEVDSEHGVWSTPRLSARERETGDHDLLLISIDTLRADHLGAYGYARNTSPVIDAELAAKGTLFEWAISTATTTGPSHMSMLTGLAPTVHGTHGFLAGLPDGVPTLASVLREQGYATAAVTENGPMAAERGFDRGFDGYIENKSADLKAHAGHVEDTLSRGLAWIRAHRDRRRFLFLHTFQVHTPYAPPPRYQNLFASDDVDPRGMSFLPPWWQPRRYDQEIRYTDTEFGAFLGALEEDGLLDDTIVVLVSDHGEEHLDHRALGHGPAVHDEILRVPLILRGPGVTAARRVTGAVSLVDLMPTLLELTTGAPAEPGRSFAALTRTDGPTVPPPPYPIYSEARAGRELRPVGRKLEWRDVPVPVFAVRLGDRKLVRHPGPGTPRYQYFDLTTDRRERRSRFDPKNPQVAELMRLLESHLETSKQQRRALRANREDPKLPLDDERREKLRALGYLE